MSRSFAFIQFIFFVAVCAFARTGWAEEAIMATLAPRGSPAAPVHAAFLDTFAAQSSGAVTITPFFSGELGPEEKYFGDLRRGRIQLAVVSSHGISAAIPEISILRAPFLFDSVEEYTYVFENFLKFDIEALFEDKGLVLFSWMVSGWDGIYAQSALPTPGDLEGVRIRVPLEPTAPLVFETLRADVIHVPFTDVITGLQTGLIEAGETTPSAYISAGLWAEAPHFNHTDHTLNAAFGIANARWFRSLQESDQQALTTSYASALDIFDEMSLRIEHDLNELENAGRLYRHRPSAEQREQWRAASEPALAVMPGVLGGRAQDLLTAVMDGKRAFAEQQQ